MIIEDEQQKDNLITKKKVENQKQVIKRESSDEDSLSSKSSKSSQSSKNIKNTKKCGDEVKFAITFIGRIIFTLYSFHGLFFIYNFIIQYIILFPGVLYEIDSLFGQLFIGFIIYLPFTVFVSNVLVIPTYDFLLFPFLNYKNPLYHLESFSRIVNIIEHKLEKEDKIDLEGDNKNVKWLNIIFIFIEVIYIIGFALNILSITNVLEDFIKVVILFLIYLYYMLIFLGYIIISFYLIVKFLTFSYSKNNGFIKGFKDIISNPFFYDSFFGEKNENNPNNKILAPLPKINLLSYVVHPILKNSYDITEITEEDKKKFSKVGKQIYWIVFKNYIRVFLFFTIYILVFIFVKNDVLSYIIFIVFFFLLISLSTILNFPVLFRNKKTFGYYFSGKIKYKKEYKMIHSKMVSFIRFICKFIVIIASIILIFAFLLMNDSNKLDDIINKSEYLKPQNSTVDRHTLLLPSICFSSIHNIPIYLYLPFINDAYYYKKPSESEMPFFESSLQIKKYRELFFDSTYEIEVKNDLIKSSKKGQDSVKMVQYNVKNSLNEVTILSIKGTSNKKDVYMDFQLYFPSILLNLLSTFSLLGQQKESWSFRFIEYSLSIPYRLFSQFSVINGYLEDLKSAYYENFPSFYNNIIIVGHSLGGGLSKLLGRLLNKQAVSLSGPGVNAFHSLWGYEGFSENFEISAIDLVPDLDLVPRVEVSGGTVYRIICKGGPFSCHGKELSLCEVLIMCRNPNYKTYCENYAELSEDQIKSLVESSDLNFDN